MGRVVSGLPKHTDFKTKLQYSYYWPVVGLFNFSFKATPGATRRPLAILGRGYGDQFWTQAPRPTDQLRLVGSLVHPKLLGRSVEQVREDLKWNLNAGCL